MITQPFQYLQSPQELDQLSSSLPAAYSSSENQLLWESLLDGMQPPEPQPSMLQQQPQSQQQQLFAPSVDEWIQHPDDLKPVTAAQAPPPALSQSLSPLSEMSLASPQVQAIPEPVAAAAQEVYMPRTTSFVKGHRRRRSSSVPSLFYSKKRQPMMMHGFSAQQAQPMGYEPAMVPPLSQVQVQTMQPNSYQMPFQKPMPIQIQRNPPKSAKKAPAPKRSQEDLDASLLKINFDDVTVAELKELLRERNLSIAGRKAELHERLHREKQRVQHARDHPSEGSTPSPASAESSTAAAAASSAAPSAQVSGLTGGIQQQLLLQQQLQQDPPTPIMVPSQQQNIHQLTDQMNGLGFASPTIGFTPSQPIAMSQQQQQQPIPPPHQQQQQQHHHQHHHHHHQPQLHDPQFQPQQQHLQQQQQQHQFHHPYQHAYDQHAIHLSSSMPHPSHHHLPHIPSHLHAENEMPAYLDPSIPMDLEQHIHWDDHTLSDFINDQPWQH
ncbi:hypothetical protein BC940DRAFT_319543 [Gongronella butleri]|nr:hypothetical protein BC940DRAFT_319543 [Gongronella butleri]